MYFTFQGHLQRKVGWLIHSIATVITAGLSSILCSMNYSEGFPPTLLPGVHLGYASWAP